MMKKQQIKVETDALQVPQNFIIHKYEYINITDIQTCLVYEETEDLYKCNYNI